MNWLMSLCAVYVAALVPLWPTLLISVVPTALIARPHVGHAADAGDVAREALGQNL
jgi:hypothetical protein